MIAEERLPLLPGRAKPCPSPPQDQYTHPVRQGGATKRATDSESTHWIWSLPPVRRTSLGGQAMVAPYVKQDQPLRCLSHRKTARERRCIKPPRTPQQACKFQRSASARRASLLNPGKPFQLLAFPCLRSPLPRAKLQRS